MILGEPSWVKRPLYERSLDESTWYQSSDGSGSKIFDPGRVGSIFCGSDWVGSAIYGLIG